MIFISGVHGVGKSYFCNLVKEAIILLTEEPEIIAKRRQERDGVDHKASDIKDFQDEEVKYAKEVSELLQVPLKISTGSNDIENTVEFIRGRRI